MSSKPNSPLGFTPFLNRTLRTCSGLTWKNSLDSLSLLGPKAVWRALSIYNGFQQRLVPVARDLGLRALLRSLPPPRVEQQHNVLIGMYDEQLPVYSVALEVRDKPHKAPLLLHHPRRVRATFDRRL